MGLADTAEKSGLACLAYVTTCCMQNHRLRSTFLPNEAERDSGISFACLFPIYNIWHVSIISAINYLKLRRCSGLILISGILSVWTELKLALKLVSVIRIAGHFITDQWC